MERKEVRLRYDGNFDKKSVSSSTAEQSREREREINDANHNKDNMLSYVLGRRDPTVFRGHKGMTAAAEAAIFCKSRRPP